LARPGGNITGLTGLGRELGGKRLALFKEAVPKVARIAILYDAGASGTTPLERRSPGRGAYAGVDRSILGGTGCGQLRAGNCCANQRAPGWSLRVCRPTNEC